MTSRPGRVAVAAVLACALLAGCGTRLDAADIAASGQTETVTLTPESIDALRAATRPAVPAAAQEVAEVAADAAPAAEAPSGEVGSKPVAAPVRANAPKATVRAPASAAVPSRQCVRSLEPISIGQVGTFSGVAGPLTGSAVTTMAAWARDVNARGGVACHPVRVFTRDDGGDPAKAAALANELAERQKVVAFVAPAVLGPAGFVQAIQKLKIPVIGGSVGQDQWFTTPHFYPEVARADDLIAGLLKQGAERGKKRLGLLYCVESPVCAEISKKVKAGVGAASGLELVYESPVSVTQTDYTAQCLNAQKAGVDLLGLGLDGASMTRVARSCASVGYRPLLTTASFAIGTAQSKDEGLRSFGVVTASGVAPWFANDVPGLREYGRAMERWAPSLETDGASISAWTSAKLFEAVVAGAGQSARSGPLTSALVEQGARTIRGVTLDGLTGPLDFTSDAKRAAGNGCSFFQFLGPQGWTAPRGSTPDCLTKR
ncbi:MAG: ABC transporter substrate-binding protein [Sporichthyaceae bacterium]